MTETKSFYSEDGKIVINLTLEEAESCAHQGPCYANVKALAQLPHIKAQLEGLDPQDVIHELRRWGYDFDRIADHDDNVERLLWIAACGIKEEQRNG